MKKILQQWDIVVLVLILLILAFYNSYFINNNNAPPYADSPFHLINGNRYYSRVSGEEIERHGEINLEYPPLLYFTSIAVYKTFGFSLKNALWSSFPFLVIFVVSIFLMGKYFGGKIGGVAAILITASSHITLEASHMYLLDLPHTAFTALGLYFLIISDKMEKPVYTFLFGISFGLAMLGKHTSIFFLSLPLLTMFIYIIRKKWVLYLLPVIPVAALSILGYIMIRHAVSLGRHIHTRNPVPYYGIPILILTTVVFFAAIIYLRRKKGRLFTGIDGNLIDSTLNGVSAILVTSLTAGVWYILTIRGVVQKMFLQGVLVKTATRSMGSLFLVSILNYVDLIKFFSIITLILALVGVVYLFLKKEKRFELILIMLCCLSGILAHAPLAHASVFYVVALFIFLSVFGSYWFKYAGKFQAIPFVLLIISSTLSFYYPFSNRATSLKIFPVAVVKVLALKHTIIPDRRDYPINHILNDLDEKKEEMLDIMGDRRLPALVYLTPEFRTAYRGPGEVNHLVFETYKEFMKIEDVFIYSFEKDWETPLKILESYPVCMIIGYCDESEIKKVKEKVHRISGRKLIPTSKYKLTGKRNLVFYNLEWDKTSDNVKTGTDFESILGRMQKRPGELEDMRGASEKMLK
ncbi:MAG: glycosyltransferase family 39 protein [Candidatus Eremiobacteraeota bacterium]|nr:glycosyltransferase family 39 protein [Candidatus Eremiobacteraeota bacterium]